MARKRNLSFDKGIVCHFVCRIENCRHDAACLTGFNGKGQGAEDLSVRFKERQGPTGKKVQGFKVNGPALWIAERILDGQPHIGAPSWAMTAPS